MNIFKHDFNYGLKKWIDIDIHTDMQKSFGKMKSTSIIGFGKLKGRPHSELLLPSNKKYAKWVIDQGEEFRYGSTRDYILRNKTENLSPADVSKIKDIKIKDLTEEQIITYLEYLEEASIGASAIDPENNVIDITNHFLEE